MSSTDNRSVSTLFGGVADQLGHLIATEARLATAELSQKIDQASTGVALVGAAGVLIIPAVVMALIALALWLSQMGIVAPLAYLISAVIAAVLGSILLFTGLNRLKLNRLKLNQTADQITQDFAAARNLAQ